jgi:XTP/dITP diphosphohydrolase
LGEFREVACDSGIAFLPLPGLTEIPEPDETGATFEQNARIKASTYSDHAPGSLVIADDSGLEVYGLGGAPGVHSARFAANSEHHRPSDRDNNHKLLTELEKQLNVERSARFVCVIALAKNGKVIETFRGEATGEILASPLGKNGFGYDPLFFVPAAHKTFAEMNVEEKSRYSHRGAAFRKLLEYLTSR